MMHLGSFFFFPGLVIFLRLRHKMGVSLGVVGDCVVYSYSGQ